MAKKYSAEEAARIIFEESSDEEVLRDIDMDSDIEIEDQVIM